MSIRDAENNLIFKNEPGATLDVRPLYPLVRTLEREWPVTVPEASVPKVRVGGVGGGVGEFRVKGDQGA